MVDVLKYHCSLDRKTTLCGRPVTDVDYVNARYWSILKARNRCQTCLNKRPIEKDAR